MGSSEALKIIIAGSRTFLDYDFLCQKLDRLLGQTQEEVEIVSGTAAGADRLGERYAVEHGLPVKQFPADWDKLGKRSYHVRNAQMAAYSTHCVLFWDGRSRGTAGMAALAKKHGLVLRTYEVEAIALPQVDTITALGHQLDSIGIIGFSDYHEWTIRQGELSDIFWNRLVKLLEKAIATKQSTPYIGERK